MHTENGILFVESIQHLILDWEQNEKITDRILNNEENKLIFQEIDLKIISI